MRLERLDLTRYGKFTDRSLEFGPREPGRPDLHIVYGPNEAGKSTLFAAFLDLVFGIEARSSYAFLHPYPTMQIGAAIETGGACREIVRIKRSQNSLLDDTGEPIAESAFFAELGGIDRDAYRIMFSLDDQTLEEGGDSILASRGELGQLLFSASAGLADLSERLVGLQAEADRFYKFRARSGELNEQKAKIAELARERDALDTKATDHAALVAARDVAAAGYDEAIAARSRTKTRLDEVGRILGALPRLAALHHIREALAPLAELPEPPADWPQDVPRLVKQGFDLEARKTAIDDEIRRLGAEIEAIPLDERAAELGSRLERLSEGRARHQTAEKDLPARRQELQAVRAEIAATLRRLDREDQRNPASLALSAATTGRLRAQIAARSGIETRVTQANREAELAGRRLAEAQAALEAAGEGRGDVSLLRAQLIALRSDDHAARRAVAMREKARLADRLDVALAALSPWRGEPQELAALTVPEAASIEGWKLALAAIEGEIEWHRRDVEAAETDAIRHRVGIEAIAETDGLVDDAEATALRAARDAAWQVHRATLDRASAERFEQRLGEDDRATGLRLARLGELARLREVRRALVLSEAMLARSQELLDAVTTRRERVLGEVLAAVKRISPLLAPDLSLAGIEAWLTRRAAALELHAELRGVERDLREAESDGRAARDGLAEALAACGMAVAANEPLERLKDRAEATIADEHGRASLRDDLAAKEQEHALRRDDRLAALKAEADWNAVWRDIGAACWLGERGAMPDVAAVSEMLAELDRLRPAVEKEAGLADRVAKMEKDRQIFAGEIEAVEAALGMAGEGAAVERADRIAKRIVAALDAASRLTGKRAELEATEARGQGLAVEIESQARQVARMTGFFGVETLEEVEVELRHASRRAELDRQRAETEREILDALSLDAIELAEAVLAGADRPALHEERAALEARLEDEDRRTQECFAARSKAVDRLEAVGGDGAIARIEEARRTLLLDIEEKAARHLRLRLGILAAEQALRAYRDRHRSSMMRRASDAFRTVSRGVYSGLATQPDRDSEVLIGIGADGSSKIATEMSKGTRFQLYLALRVAGYLEFARARQPLPFIADDILETFDDFRAEEAIRMFAGMAEVGQVIYLTHHRHLRDIAAEACPGARFHELPGPGEA